MANLKNITDLPIAESAEGLNLIVNDNGSAKQIAASAVGAQADFSVTDETSPAYIKNKPEVVQADWSVVDEANPAFVKNRTHYIEKNTTVEILPEATYILNTQDDYSEAEFANPFIVLEAGKTYQVSYNGATYECVGKDVSEPIGTSAVMVGNTIVFGQDTGEPFAFIVTLGQGCVLISFNSDAEATFSITYVGDVYHTINPNYIKDMYYSEQFTNVEVLAETTQAFTEGEALLQEPMVSLVEGGVYTVIWNGVEYTCFCESLDDGELLLYSDVFEIIQHPEMIYEGLYAVIYALDDTTSVTLSITGNYSVVHKINEKYIPRLKEMETDISTLREDFNNLASSVVNVYSGTTEPTSNIGEDGDVYLVTEG